MIDVIGVVSGLVSGLGTAIVNYKMQRLKNEHDLAIINAQTTAMIAESNAAIKIEESRAAGEVEKAESLAFVEGQKMVEQDALKESFIGRLFEYEGTFKNIVAGVGVALVALLGLVDVFRRSVRPGLTLYLVCVTTWITAMSWDILTINRAGIDVATATGIFNDVIMTVRYLTVTVVSFWFFDRRVAKFLFRLDNQNKPTGSPGSAPF